jgi:hypothetical protein
MIQLDLLDASTLITAHNSYYAIDQVPEFWEWLQYQGEAGRVKLPQEIMEEVKAGRKENDLLIDWLSQPEVEAALLLEEAVDIDVMQAVVSNGYAPDLNDVELEAIGRDPFLIAYALAKPDQRCVVTVENKRPGAQRHKRKIPDVCITMGVQWCGPFDFTRRLGWNTRWKSNI